MIGYDKRESVLGRFVCVSSVDGIGRERGRDRISVAV